MSEPFEVIPKAKICQWLRSLVRSGTHGTHREGPTLRPIARYMGIEENTLKFFAHYGEARMSDARQRHFSKVIAMIENGQLEFVVAKSTGKKKTLVPCDKPRPWVRYKVEFGKTGPRLRTVDRRPPFRVMPSFKQIVLK